MTLQEFETKLRALLREATEAGLDTDEVWTVAEYILEEVGEQA